MIVVNRLWEYFPTFIISHCSKLYLRSSSTGVGVDARCGKGLDIAFGVSEVSSATVL